MSDNATEYLEKFKKLAEEAVALRGAMERKTCLKKYQNIITSVSPVKLCVRKTTVSTVSPSGEIIKTPYSVNRNLKRNGDIFTDVQYVITNECPFCFAPMTVAWAEKHDYSKMPHTRKQNYELSLYSHMFLRESEPRYSMAFVVIWDNPVDAEWAEDRELAFYLECMDNMCMAESVKFKSPITLLSHLVYVKHMGTMDINHHSRRVEDEVKWDMDNYPSMVWQNSPTLHKIMNLPKLEAFDDMIVSSKMLKDKIEKIEVDAIAHKHCYQNVMNRVYETIVRMNIESLAGRTEYDFTPLVKFMEQNMDEKEKSDN